MKLQFTVKDHTLPENWAHHGSWPSKGVYRVASEPERLYVVGSWNVDVIYDTGSFVLVEDGGESVSEALLLKAIAAAAHAKVLS